MTDTKFKTVSVCIPTYNEKNNISLMVKEIERLFKEKLSEYQLEILIIDNCSTDGTQKMIESICKEKSYVKAIFNTRNFGPFNSQFYGMCQTSGDAVVLITADFQEPVALIEKFVTEWEKDKEICIICGIRTKSNENKIKYAFRQLYYRLIDKFSDFRQLHNFTGFGLYDRKVVEEFARQKDAVPFIRGMVAEYGFKRKEIEYEQSNRRSGKSSFNFYRYYDAAMIGFIAYTKIGMRMAVFIGFFVSIISFLVAVVYLTLKLLYWNEFPGGTATILIGVFFLSSIQLIFIGILGEYILTLNVRARNMPLVIERCRINFNKEE